MKLRAIVAVLGLGVTGCGVTLSGSEPYRCFHEVSLQQLIEAEGWPKSQRSDWTNVATSTENRLFDGEQETILSLDSPSPFVGQLCARLKSQLAARCNITSFWAGVDYCSAVVESPHDAVTSDSGRYVCIPSRSG